MRAIVSATPHATELNKTNIKRANYLFLVLATYDVPKFILSHNEN